MFDLQPSRTRWSMAVSFGINAVLVAAALLLPSLFPPRTVVNAFLPEDPNEHIVWLTEPGPGGGGGGGGNKMKEPPRIAELPGKDKITVPVEKPPALDAEAAREGARAVAQLNIPAVTLGAPPSRCQAPSIPDRRCQLSRRDRAPAGERAPGAARASVPAPVRVSAPEPAAAPAAAPIGPATASRRRELAAGSEAAVHRRRHAREGAGHRLARMRRACRTASSATAASSDRSTPTFGLDQEAIKAAQQWRFARARDSASPCRSSSRSS